MKTILTLFLILFSLNGYAEYKDHKSGCIKRSTLAGRFNFTACYWDWKADILQEEYNSLMAKARHFQPLVSDIRRRGGPKNSRDKLILKQNREVREQLRRTDYLASIHELRDKAAKDRRQAKNQGSN